MKLTDTEILNWLDMNLTIDQMVDIFGTDGLASDGGPRDLRAAVEAKVEKGEV